MASQPDTPAVRRFERIVAAVEQATDRMLAEAEREAAARLRRVTELTDGLIDRAERLCREMDALLESLPDPRAEASRGAADPAPVPDQPPASDSPPVADAPPFSDPAPFSDFAPTPQGSARPELRPLPDPEPPPAENGDGNGDSVSLAGARLLATQMAMSGRDRAGVAAHLRRELSPGDAEQVLDAVFGSEG